MNVRSQACNAVFRDGFNVVHRSVWPKFWCKGKLSILYPSDILMDEGIKDKGISYYENDGQKIILLPFDVTHLKTKDFFWWISVVRNDCKKLIFSDFIDFSAFSKSIKYLSVTTTGMMVGLLSQTFLFLLSFVLKSD